jgi:ferrous iron transport protein B
LLNMALHHRAAGRWRRRRNRHRHGQARHLTIALAGNANVGKSVIFNQLTGAQQTIGNWPGKTVEKATGLLSFDGYDITVVDLPGIYSLSTFSLEEIVSREYIARERPDVIINVVGAPVLERNLFFTLQLLDMDVPVVVCLNQMDIALGRGIDIDTGKMESILGIKVVPTVAARGQGIHELVETAIKVAEAPGERGKSSISYGDKVETAAAELSGLIKAEGLDLGYPPRFVAIKLLEGDTAITESAGEKSPKLVDASAELSRQMGNTYQQPDFTVVTSERYALANRIAGEVQIKKTLKLSFADHLDRVATHKVYGYLISFAVIAGLLLWTFTIGWYLSGLLSNALSFFQPVDPQVHGSIWGVIGNGIFGGFVAGATLVIPYVVPFYFILTVLEDSGILTRIAFMLDSAMHQMGLHGKAIIPIILGYGCNVPAIYSTRIMGTRRERLLAAFAITFAPCTARTIIIFGLVATFVGIPWALALYAINLLIMFVAAKLAAKAVPGELTGLIMEMHSFKVPSLAVVGKQTWARTKSLIFMVFPMYMVGTAAVQVAYTLHWLQPVNNALSFLTVSWLGLPALGGILLIFGAARKELILLMAVALLGTNLAAYFTTSQLIVLALVGTIYPCFATIGALTREFGWKSAWAIIGANVAVALLIGGIFAKLFTLFS